MKLTDVCSLEKWKEVEMKIAASSGMDTNVFDTDGFRITDYKHWANRLCPAIKATDKGQSFICAVAHMNIAAQAEQTGREVLEECDAGLVKLVVPVLLNEEFIGTIGACGLLFDTGEVDVFLVNKITGIEEKQIENLAENIDKISLEKLKSVAALINGELKRITGE